MSLIPCTENCQYQKDGLCRLSQPAENQYRAVPNDRCLNFTPRLNQHCDGLPDVADLDQLQSFRND